MAQFDQTRAFQAEMGIQEDGSTATGFGQRAGNNKYGLGSGGQQIQPGPTSKLQQMLMASTKQNVPVSGVAVNARTGQGDLYDTFRTSRSIKYHVAAETRQKVIAHEQLKEQGLVKRGPPAQRHPEFDDAEPKCFICQKGGHFAKDCRYGIS